ncbi:hypothetical protein BJ322DRAFT_1208302, partial [Thelephora terrestris]
MNIPVNKLPPELLSRILEHRDCEEDLSASTHVCQYWRSTLTSSPSLWSHLVVESKRDVGRALTYLKRSKSAAIHVWITIDVVQDLDVLQRFTPHISRTRSFSIQGYINVHLASSLLLCSPVPLLEHLEIRAHGGPVRNIDNFPLPSLTELELCLLEHSGSIRISSLFLLFSNCPRLQKIRVRIFDGVLQDLSPHHVTSLESVVDLSYASNVVEGILPCLKLPRLKRLR